MRRLRFIALILWIILMVTILLAIPIGVKYAGQAVAIMAADDEYKRIIVRSLIGQGEAILKQHQRLTNIETLLAPPLPRYREHKPDEGPSRGSRGERRQMLVTAYTANDGDKRPGHPWYGITATGRQLTDADAWRVAAADPRYYPAGTRLLIYHAGRWHPVTVADTGGLVKGPGRLDWFAGMESRAAADEFGAQLLEVLVLR